MVPRTKCREGADRDARESFGKVDEKWIYSQTKPTHGPRAALSETSSYVGKRFARNIVNNWYGNAVLIYVRESGYSFLYCIDGGLQTPLLRSGD